MTLTAATLALISATLASLIGPLTVTASMIDPVAFAAQTSQTTKSLQLVAGYNFISLPLEDYSFTASKVIASIGSAAESISRFDSATQSYVTYDKKLAGFGVPQDDFSVEPHVGYILYASRASTLTIQGYIPTTRVISLKPGYNLVGWTSSTSSKVKKALVDPSSGAVDSVSSFEETTQAYVTYDANLAAFGVQQPDFDVRQGEAYYVFAKREAVLNYDEQSTGTIGAGMALHVDGRWIKNSAGGTVLLRGVCKHGFEDHYAGQWQRPDGGTDYYKPWNPSLVGANLDAMKSWGANAIRINFAVKYWIENTGGFRSNIKSLADLASQRGMYIIFAAYECIPYPEGGTRDSMPYPPYSKSSSQTVIKSEQDFVNLWANIASELGTQAGHDNVLFELWNEPTNDGTGYPEAEVKQSWFAVAQRCINSIRGTGANNLILVQWNYGLKYNYNDGKGSFLDWVEAFPLNDPLGNIVYSTHIYSDGGWWPRFYDYDKVKTAFQKTLIEHVTSTLNKPVLIGEMGCNNDANTGLTLQQELTFFDNALTVLDEWSIGYMAWWWWPRAKFRLLLEQPNFTPNQGGQILVNHLT